MKNYFDSWWAQNHHNFQGTTDAQAQEIWSAAQTAANKNQPCEWCNSTSAKIDSLENQLELAIQHAIECDANAPWLTAAHTLCTDYRIEQGHISERLESLRKVLVQAYKHCDSEAEIATLRGNDNRKLRNANAMLETELERLNALLNRPVAGSKFVDLRQLVYSKAKA